MEIIIDSKKRSILRGMANNLNECVIIGKEGITENVKKQIEDSLTCHELIKIKLLESFELSAKDTINDLAKTMRAEPIQAVGRKIVLYRRSYRKDIKHIQI